MATCFGRFYTICPLLLKQSDVKVIFVKK